ncbi:single-stranded DNA-binding protein [Aspergillus saccharolyticus JOP 1030-1]|uniref:Nucleic acid-binding protein n=1 Tax=Aspergillus saccharolyticus JOP 1030-1 TaxID=1450539 RepID=A0A318Z5N2_9EURO|nr:nucleic acid-binding protein [Aspergillus saccharolyticus JOP 1030-1]PYH41734.1 nucleic acid-binding protein [Aspergillus saccharolyticus JOP 1030-1]
MSAFLSSLRPALRATSGAAQAARSFSSSSSRSAAKMMITGRLTAEPELHVTASGQEIVKYSVASHTYKADKPASFFNIGAFPEGNQKDFILSLPKGTLVFVEGDAYMRQHEDSNGNKRQTLNILQRERPAQNLVQSQYSDSSLHETLTIYTEPGTLEVLRRPYIPAENSESDGTN